MLQSAQNLLRVWDQTEKNVVRKTNNALKEAKVLPTTPCPDPGPSSLGTTPTPDHKNSPLPVTT